MAPVRLDPRELEFLILFGSRTDLRKKGGDIDLWLELEEKPAEPSALARRLRCALYDGLGEQKIDLQISGPADAISNPQQRYFFDVIQPTRVILWKEDPSPGSWPSN